MSRPYFYIDWEDTRIKKVDKYQFNRIVDILERYGYKRKYPSFGCRTITSKVIMDRSYFIVTGKNYVMLYVYLCNKVRSFGMRYCCGGTGNIAPTSGRSAYLHIENMFKKIAHVHSPDFFNGYNQKEKLFRLIKLCVPAPINWSDPQISRRIISNVYRADVSSAYPFEGTKSLPLQKGAIKIDGQEVDPSQEYPFAFYPHKNALAIWQELDTRTYFQRPEYKYDEPEKDNQICTILCPAAYEHPLQQIFTNIYNGRDSLPQGKLWMNAYIGYCHANHAPILSQIPAVIIARCNERIFRMCDELRRRGQHILLINTDSITWCGTDQPDLVTNVKSLGAMYSDDSMKNMQAQICSPKKYQLKHPDGSVETLWAGDHKGEDYKKYFFGKFLTMDTIEKSYVFDPEKGKIVEKFETEYGQMIGDVVKWEKE